MKTGPKFFIAFVGLSILCAWTTKQTSDITKAEWLIGTWENKTQGKHYRNLEQDERQ